MVSPISNAVGGALSGAGRIFQPLTSAVSRAFTLPSLSSSITLPSAPPGLIPAQVPTSKPAKASQQQSFLSGASQAAAAGGGGGSTGKTLIGS